MRTRSVAERIPVKSSKTKIVWGVVRQVMPAFASQKNVIILCDSWYAKKNLACVVDEYPNLDLICNARYDSVIYDLAPQRSSKRERPAEHGKRLSKDKDFSLSDDKIGDYYIVVRRVLTNIFGCREVLSYVTSAEKENISRRLFLSTIFPEQMQIFCAWQEKAPLNQTGSDRMNYIPLFCYSFRRNIEVSYYEQKTFWSFCSYMVRSRNGIETQVNLINIAYCAMKILTYQDEAFSKYHTESVQEFRFVLSEQIQAEVFLTAFLRNIENNIKSNSVVKALKQLIQQRGTYL